MANGLPGKTAANRYALPRAVSLIVGTAIGAGIFGLPYAFQQSGVWIGLGYLIVLTIAVSVTLWAYGVIVAATPGRHQVAGYARRYLGRGWEGVALISLVLGVYGALMAYLVGMGTFLHAILEDFVGGPVLLYSVIAWMVVSLALLFEIRGVAGTEMWMVAVMLVLIGIFLLIGVPEVNPSNWKLELGSDLLLPFGVVLFALGAATAVPEAWAYLKSTRQERQILPAIILGIAIPAVIYGLFAFLVVGVSGTATSENAVLGLKSILGPVVVVVGAVLGALTMATSFIGLGVALEDQFRFDFKAPKWLAWFLVVVPPMAVVLAGFNSFIELIGIAGSLIGGVDGILILLMYTKMRLQGKLPSHHKRIPTALVSVILFIYTLGILTLLFRLLSGSVF